MSVFDTPNFWDLAKPRFTVIPEDNYDVRVESIEEVETSGAGKLPAGVKMLKSTFVIDGGDHADRQLTDRYVVGSEIDPDCEDPETLGNSVGFDIMVRFFEAAHGGERPSLALKEAIQATVGRKLTLRVAQSTWKDRVQNEIKGYYVLGKVPTNGKSPAAAEAPKTRRRRKAKEEAAPAAAPAATAGEPTAPCTLCEPQQDVPLSQFGEHMQTHVAAQV